MKKRKTYEISVIDKTYSKTISDETKFYTSDTALELVFKLKETEYTFESAEIVLFNTDDRSLVTRPVSKRLNSFAYELEDDIIAHYGEWHGQLRFEQAGEIYVSSLVKFRIENDLDNERPPQLTDVQTWVSLKRYADSLTEELKQAVLEVEGMDATFQANELERQTTFENNESERNQTFESNETIRQTQELGREKAEAERQTTFENNEASRFETFNTNEDARQANETTRQQAETQRATAESSRVSAEEQRKTDHANRSAELDRKVDKVILDNEVTNGNFSDGVNGWSGFHSTIEFTGNVLTMTSDGSRINPYIVQSIDVDIDDIIYGMVKIKPLEKVQSIYIMFDVINHAHVYDPETNTYHYLSFTHKKSGTNPILGIRTNLLNIVEGVKIDIKDIGLINLTKTFGKGNEPTKEEMDELIKVTGYIDDEYALNNKEMLIWTLALIRSNKNAIITLGGA